MLDNVRASAYGTCMNNTDRSISIADQQRIDRVRARKIDGADHDVKAAPLTGICKVCGKSTGHNPTTPYARVHRA